MHFVVQSTLHCPPWLVKFEPLPDGRRISGGNPAALRDKLSRR